MQLTVGRFEDYGRVVLQREGGPMADHEFLELCERYPDLRIESTAEGDIVLMHPVHPRMSRRNARISASLHAWAESDGRGDTFDSSVGFFLPNGARRSPDASWASHARIARADSDEAMWRITPEFVIELKSGSDRMRVLRDKMREWIANGVQLAWLIDPDARTVEIYRADGSVETLADPAEVHGEGPVAGFRLGMTGIW